jgi:hypothetical protein
MRDQCLVGMPFSISRSGACTSSPAHAWQACWGDGHDHLEVRRDDIEPFRDVLADPVLEAAAARAGLVRTSMMISRAADAAAALRD